MRTCLVSGASQRPRGVVGSLGEVFPMAALRHATAPPQFVWPTTRTAMMGGMYSSSFSQMAYVGSEGEKRTVLDADYLGGISDHRERVVVIRMDLAVRYASALIPTGNEPERVEEGHTWRYYGGRRYRLVAKR